MIDAAQHNLNLHETLHAIRKEDDGYQNLFRTYLAQYQLPSVSSSVSN